MDTRDVITVTPTSDGASVDLLEPASNVRLDAWFAKHGRHKVRKAHVIKPGITAARGSCPGCLKEGSLYGRYLPMSKQNHLVGKWTRKLSQSVVACKVLSPVSLKYFMTHKHGQQMSITCGVRMTYAFPDTRSLFQPLPLCRLLSQLASLPRTQKARPPLSAVTAPTFQPPSLVRCSGQAQSPSGQMWTESTAQTLAR